MNKHIYNLPMKRKKSVDFEKSTDFFFEIS